MTEIKIGTQIWMSENLNVDCFSNGDPIPEAKTKDEWAAAGSNKQPAWCLYKNSQFLGKLYNYYALSDIRRIEPEGWRLSTRMDWESLFEYIGGTKLAGKKLKNNSSSWEEFGGDNDFNFSVLPGGFRSSEFLIIAPGYYWSSIELSRRDALYIRMCDGVTYNFYFQEDYKKKTNEYLVRPVRKLTDNV